jgi:2-methylaconitate cis-trans-isomerase PrpF
MSQLRIPAVVIRGGTSKGVFYVQMFLIQLLERDDLQISFLFFLNHQFVIVQT